MSFSERVYEITGKIPKGKVSTYGEIAKALGKPGSPRAVGQALKRNPRPGSGVGKVPCHRVVKSDLSLGGFSGSNPKSIRKKQALLRSEGVTFSKGKTNKENLFVFRKS